MEVSGHLPIRVRRRRRTAVPKSCAIVDARLREATDVRLNIFPHRSIVPKTSVKDDDGAASADAMDVERNPADVDDTIDDVVDRRRSGGRRGAAARSEERWA